MNGDVVIRFRGHCSDMLAAIERQQEQIQRMMGGAVGTSVKAKPVHRCKGCGARGQVDRCAYCGVKHG